MDEAEHEHIELLGDEFHHALVGAVFENDGTPVPCYSSGMVVEQLMSEGLTEEQAGPRQRGDRGLPRCSGSPA